MEAQIYQECRDLLKTAFAKANNKHHTEQHIRNVLENSFEIAKIYKRINEKEIDIDLLELCVLGHDMAYTTRETSFVTWLFEGYFAKKVLEKLLDEKKLGKYAYNTIIETARYHPHSFPFHILVRNRSFYTKIVQDADTIDYFNLDRIVAAIRSNFFASRIRNFGIRLTDNYLNLEESKEYVYRKFSKVSEYDFIVWNENQKNMLLCIHGYADDKFLFEKFAELVKDKYKVVSLTLPIYKQEWTIEKLGVYVKDFCEDNKLSPYAVVGFSLGGLVAIEYSFSNNTKLVLLNSLPRLRKRKLPTVCKVRPVPFLYSRSRLFAERFIKSLTPDTAQRLKQNHLPLLRTAVNATKYNGLEKFIKIQAEKAIVIFKDDRVVSTKKAPIKEIQNYIVYADAGGHNSKKCYWDNTYKVLFNKENPIL